MIKKVIAILLVFVMIFGFTSCMKKPNVLLERNDWADDVKKGINDLVTMYPNSGYAVFDFDNTSSIFDIEEQLIIYQIEKMAFAIEPKDMKGVLLSGLTKTEAYLDLVTDISNAYSYLWDNYGPFTGEGIDNASMLNDTNWMEFASKMRYMYDYVDELESSYVGYPWITFWFTGMTEEEIYDLGLASIEEYSKVETFYDTWTSPKEIESLTGVISVSFYRGITVTENIKELWKVLSSNGIDVWVVSASCTACIRAAIDYFGLHSYLTGMLGMTNKKDEDGRYITEYDYDNGCGYLVNGDTWEKMTTPTKTQTQGKGKVIAIQNAISPRYDNRGPIAGFMDSTGDFNFCTEFSSLKLVVCFNRANRKITDGGGVIAVISQYQKGKTLKSVKDDTLYLLQGRDENGLRSFRNSSFTLRLNETEEKLFANEDNYKLLETIKSEKMTIKEAVDKYAYNFLESYDGYHSI